MFEPGQSRRYPITVASKRVTSYIAAVAPRAVLRPVPAVAVFAALGLMAACTPPSPATSANSTLAAIGTLRPPSELGPDFQWRQRVTAEWPEGTRSFDAVLTKQGGSLLLVGLGPMDTPGFVLEVDAQGTLHVENHTERPIPFDPKFVLLDVQRAFYPWFPAPLLEGERTGTNSGDTVTENWLNSRLQRRTFTRVDRQPPGSVVVRYEGWEPSSRAPRRATLRNEWFGYTLTVETTEQTDL